MCTLLVLILAAAFTPAAQAAEPMTDVDVFVNDEFVELPIPALLINSTTYVPLRAFSMAMGAESVSWNPDTDTASVHAPNLTIEIFLNGQYIIANDRYLYTEYGCPLINSSLMVPVRVISAAFDAAVEWHGVDPAVYVTSGTGSIVTGNVFYDETDLHWLSRIIDAEARGESLAGKIAVGNVVLNRVESPLFPDNVYDVIFDDRFGIQFSPAYSGSVYCNPCTDSVLAAKFAFEGVNTAGDSLYFASVSGSWASANRPYVTTIGNHYFYA